MKTLYRLSWKLIPIQSEVQTIKFKIIRTTNTFLSLCNYVHLCYKTVTILVLI